MKKKLIYGLILPLLAVVLVSAAILTCYAQFWTTLNITQQIDVNSVLPYTTDDIIDCDSGEFCVGDELRINNGGDDDKIVTIISSGCGIEADISYVGKLELTKKNTATWQPITPKDSINIIYTVVGDTFKAIGIPAGYTLVYYKEDPTSTSDADRLTKQGTVYAVTESLPNSDDWNAGVLANYCGNGYDHYDHCKGAKLWAVKTEDISGNTLSWAHMADYYYETDLVYYFDNINGKITIPAKSFITVYPAFDVEELAYGTCNASTTIA